jgi:hypothetical protein
MPDIFAMHSMAVNAAHKALEHAINESEDDAKKAFQVAEQELHNYYSNYGVRWISYDPLATWLIFCTVLVDPCSRKHACEDGKC